MTRCGRGEQGRKLDGRAQWNRYGRTRKKMARSDLRGKENGKDVGKVEEQRMDDTFRDAGQKGHFHTRKWVEE